MRFGPGSAQSCSTLTVLPSDRRKPPMSIARPSACWLRRPPPFVRRQEKLPRWLMADNPPAKLFNGERLDHLALEIIEPARQPTAHDGRMVKHRLDPADPHRGIDLAARIRRVDRV